MMLQQSQPSSLLDPFFAAITLGDVRADAVPPEHLQTLVPTIEGKCALAAALNCAHLAAFRNQMLPGGVVVSTRPLVDWALRFTANDIEAQRRLIVYLAPNDLLDVLDFAPDALVNDPFVFRCAEHAELVVNGFDDEAALDFSNIPTADYFPPGF